jgi:hypothetical protein
MTHGIDIFTNKPLAEKQINLKESTSFDKQHTLIDFLRQFLFSEQNVLKEIATEGFARLYFINEIIDPKVSQNFKYNNFRSFEINYDSVLSLALKIHSYSHSPSSLVLRFFAIWCFSSS